MNPNSKSFQTIAQQPISNTNFSILKKEADSGSAEAQFRISLYYCREQSYSSAAHYCQLAANQNHPEAQFLLATLYENGLGITQSNEQAFHYYQLAPDQGNPHIQFQVAEYFEQMGHALEGSIKSTFYYYKLAADQGHLQSIKLLFKSYHYGKYVEQPYEEALKYLCLGVQFTDSECRYHLGRYYREG